MPRFCSSCGSQMEDSATFCPACGKAAGQSSGTATGTAPASSPVVTSAAVTGGGLEDNIAGLLAYVTIIPAIVFLVMEPYNRKPFIRFHSFQCLFLAAASVALGIVLMILGMIPVIGLLMLFVGPIIWLGVFVLAVVCAIKAYQGQKWKLPFIGDLAEKQANG